MTTFYISGIPTHSVSLTSFVSGGVGYRRPTSKKYRKHRAKINQIAKQSRRRNRQRK